MISKEVIIKNLKMNVISTPFLAVFIYYMSLHFHFYKDYLPNILIYLFMSQLIIDSLRGKLAMNFIFVFVCLFAIMVPFLWKYYLIYFLFFPLFFKLFTYISNDMKKYLDNARDKKLPVSVIGFVSLFLSSLIVLIGYIFFRQSSHQFDNPEVELVLLPNLFGIVGYYIGNLIEKKRSHSLSPN